MSKNDDAHSVAARLHSYSKEMPLLLSAAHREIERLVAENEAQAALIRQAEEALEKLADVAESILEIDDPRIQLGDDALAAICKHREGKQPAPAITTQRAKIPMATKYFRRIEPDDTEGGAA